MDKNNMNKNNNVFMILTFVFAGLLLFTILGFALFSYFQNMMMSTPNSYQNQHCGRYNWNNCMMNGYHNESTEPINTSSVTSNKDHMPGC